VLVLFGGRMHPLRAQESACDPSLPQSSKEPNGYRQRGDRCEGVYIQAVASPALRVVSWTESFEDFDPAVSANLRLEWSVPPGAGPVHLRANALRRHLYYRFDAIRPDGSTSYDWPVAMLRGLDLRKPELGIVAWTAEPVGGTPRDIHLPLRVGQASAPASARRYQLVLVPGAELIDIYLSLAPVQPDGQPGAFVQRDRRLERGYYPAERGIPIPIAGLTQPGVYYLQISATLRAGRSSTTRLWFYHPGG
jgi:hypothetical protein